jgi:hypothetical protein
MFQSLCILLFFFLFYSLGVESIEILARGLEMSGYLGQIGLIDYRDCAAEGQKQIGHIIQTTFLGR